MKKAKLLFISILFYSIAFSQEFYKIERASLFLYVDEAWKNVATEYPANMFLNINGSDIRFNNDDKSHYKTYGNSEKTTYQTHTCYSWNCMDKEGKDCTFLIKKFKDGTKIVCFLYSFDRKLYEYTIENE